MSWLLAVGQEIDSRIGLETHSDLRLRLEPWARDSGSTLGLETWTRGLDSRLGLETWIKYLDSRLTQTWVHNVAESKVNALKSFLHSQVSKHKKNSSPSGVVEKYQTPKASVNVEQWELNYERQKIFNKRFFWCEATDSAVGAKLSFCHVCCIVKLGPTRPLLIGLTDTVL